MRIYNSMSRSIEELIPEKEGKINFFVCGPTVYDDIHIGNARTFVIFDSIVKYLRHRGYLVFYVLNVTDIDDKIIAKAHEENTSAEEISMRYLQSFIRNMKLLRVDSISILAPSSRFIQEIIEQIRILEEKGYAYKANDGIYFRVKKFKDYGKLSGQKIDQLIRGGRVRTDQSKEQFQDFVLWKLKKPGEPYWNSPWGEGRPGWHIEDTAITEYFFGSTYDIHGAGSDLIFPHHEAEIAQMRSISEKEILSRYWMHSGMLNMVEEKMAKSTGNIVRLGEMLAQYSAEDLRFFFLNSNYRNVLEFSDARVEEASVSRSKIQILYEKLKNHVPGDGSYNPGCGNKTQELIEHLENDFDTRSFFRDLLEYVSEVFRNIDRLDSEGSSSVLHMLDEFDSVFGIIAHRKADLPVKELISSLLEYRDRLRNQKKYEESDEIRKILKDSGISVEDQANRTDWRA